MQMLTTLPVSQTGFIVQIYIIIIGIAAMLWGEIFNKKSLVLATFNNN